MTRGASVFLPEIQALRALAVGLVVVFHLWPSLLPGGYVGVDAFFVLSGFLITSHLLRELLERGTIGLSGFWARRIRRLLPASLFVLGCVTAALPFVPATHFERFTGEALGATFYVLNWLLARSAVDYWADDAASPVQHYWSLSVEEQFYLFWPLLLVVFWRLGRGRRGLWFGLLALVSLSLADSVWATWSEPRSAYFVTQTRAWEFGCGALLALCAERLELGQSGARWAGARALLGWAGMLGLLGAACVFSATTPFPGFAALWPVAATVAVVIGGRPGLPWALTRLYEARPVQWLGELSYSLYLWHWPLYVLAPLLLPLAAGAPETAGAEGSGWRFGVLVASLGLSWLTHRFIEEPVRRGRMAQRPAWQSYVAALVATALLGGVLLAEKRWLGRAVERGQPAALAGRLKQGEVVRCFGAASTPGSEACRNGELAGVVLPRPEKAKSDRGWTTCMVEEAEDRVRFCETGSPVERASRTVLLVGDSHAEHWLPALDTLAPLEDWRILRVLKSKCSLNEATPDNTRASQKSCAQWNAGVHAELARHPEIREVFVSASAFNAYRTEPGVRWQDRAAEGYVAAWSRLPASIERIWVIRDLPRPRPDVIDCLARLGEAERARPGPCARPRSDALLDDPLLAAARREPRARVIDLSERFCDQRSCYPMIGHSIVYRDKSHLGATFARTLAPHLERALESAR